MLGALRDKSGKPSGLIKALAALIALLLALPLTLFVGGLVSDLADKLF